jgi:hypothetical protein
MARVIDLREPGAFPGGGADLPLELPNPLDEMERLARSIVEGRAAGVENVLEEGRRRLQRAAAQELHRLVGQFVVEVTLAQTPRAQVGRAIACGSKILESRPPDHVVAEFVDPEGFVEGCRAACAALIRFLGVSLNHSLAAAGQKPIENIEPWLAECARELHLAVVGTATDGIDRKAQLAVLFAETLNLPRRARSEPHRHQR